MTLRCLNAYLDRNLGAGWFSVYAPRKSHVVVEFAAVPKKDKAEPKRQPSNEKLALNKLSCITGWVVPRFYSEYEWHGGRALVPSDQVTFCILKSSHCCRSQRGMARCDFS
jgi:hypothetical protein